MKADEKIVLEERGVGCAGCGECVSGFSSWFFVPGFVIGFVLGSGQVGLGQRGWERIARKEGRLECCVNFEEKISEQARSGNV